MSLSKTRRAGLKSIIRRSQLMASGVVDAPFTIPGEPLAYSFKYPVGKRMRGLNHFRNLQWKSLLKCFFCSQFKTQIPVVLNVSFFVSPPPHVIISPKDLRSEKFPAVHSFEVCDYVLSFIEMLHKVLFNSYRQIVKLNVEKYYSDDPRTVFQFLRWSQYIHLPNKDTFYTKTKGVGSFNPEGCLQSECSGNEPHENVRKDAPSEQEATFVHRPSSGDSDISNTSTVELAREKKTTPKLRTAHQEARRRQSGQVPQ